MSLFYTTSLLMPLLDQRTLQIEIQCQRGGHFFRRLYSIDDMMIFSNELIVGLRITIYNERDQEYCLHWQTHPTQLL